jgi:hypothetical protein
VVSPGAPMLKPENKVPSARANTAGGKEGSKGDKPSPVPAPSDAQKPPKRPTRGLFMREVSVFKR